MTSSAREFRRTRLDVLRILSNPGRQREFAAKVSYADYASEFLSWWEDDFHPDSALFAAAFTMDEIATLRACTTSFEKHAASLGDAERSVEELLATPEWRAIIACAAEALAGLKPEGG